MLQHVIPGDAIERRVATLDLQDNDYFAEGARLAESKAEAKGYRLPDFNLDSYLRKDIALVGTSNSSVGRAQHLTT